MENPKFQIPMYFGISGLVAIVLSKVVEVATDQKSYPIAWLASLLVVTSMIYIRKYSIDEEKFSTVIVESNPTEYTLHPKLYLDFMTIAMITGFIAVIVIRYNFIAGMIIYLVMQLCLIRAFSGIFIINPRITFTHYKLGNITKISAIFWTLYVILVYSIFVYNGPESLIVIPYVICLGTMAHITWYGLGYSRTPRFKQMLIAASAFFVFSDSLIGNYEFGKNKASDSLYLTIDITYVISIFLLTTAVLFLKDKEKYAILKY